MTSFRSQPLDEQWDQICAMVRRYSLRRYGRLPEAISLRFPGGERTEELLPIAPLSVAVEPVEKPSPPADDWGSGPVPKRLSDCQRIYWPGFGVFNFSGKQREAMKLLWEAWEDGTHDVRQDVLLRAADSSCDRFYDLMKNHPGRPMQRKLIIAGGQPATFRLAPLPEDDGEA